MTVWTEPATQREFEGELRSPTIVYCPWLTSHPDQVSFQFVGSKLQWFTWRPGASAPPQVMPLTGRSADPSEASELPVGSSPASFGSSMKLSPAGNRQPRLTTRQ